MRRRFWPVVFVVTVLAALPYLTAWAMTPPGYRYAGINYNTLDAATYLAKMRLGWLGEWRFRLMFTPEAQQGAYLNLYYIFLGHVARISGLPVVVVLHLARLGGGVLLMAVLWTLCRRLARHDKPSCWGFWFAMAGGGIGWALPWIKQNTVDLWVPEAYGFYSILVNAHFAVAQALMVLILLWTDAWAFAPARPRHALPLLVLTTVTLSVVQPFGLVTVALTWGFLLIARSIAQRRILWGPGVFLGVVGAAGALYPLYAVWATAADPILAGWSAQNITPSPPWWNWAIGYGLLLPFAVLGFVVIVRNHAGSDVLLPFWILATLVGIALPITLQRRLSLGLSLPLGLLAGQGWETLLARIPRRRFLANGVMLVLTAVTPLLLVAGGVFGVDLLHLHDLIYVSAGEFTAGKIWLDHSLHDVFLSTPTRGALLPWIVGQQVVVGHPMETVDYTRRADEAQAFFDGRWPQDEQRAYLCREGVDYVWVGPIERRLMGNATFALPGTSLVVENADVAVYEVADVCGGLGE